MSGHDADNKPSPQPGSRPESQPGSEASQAGASGANAQANPEQQAQGEPQPTGDGSKPQGESGAGPSQSGVHHGTTLGPGGLPVRRQPYRPEQKLPLNPRRVRGGVKLGAKEGEPLGNWISQRFFRIVEEEGEGEALREGLNYARLGQTKTLEITEKGIQALVQGRKTRPYTVSINLKQFDAEQRAKIIETMVDQSRYAAKLLAGELPSDIEDMFAPLGLKLFPTELKQVETSCKCGEGPWCKHAICVTALIAERMAKDPFILFALRGMASDEMLESIRERRAIAAQGERAVPVHRAHVPGASDFSAPPLEEQVDRFWISGAMDSNQVDLTVQPPEVTHALLRRLGPSPFEGSRFRFVGLLATCYEMIGEKSLEAAGPAGDSGSDESDEIEASDPDA